MLMKENCVDVKCVRGYNIHCRSRSYKLKFGGKSVARMVSEPHLVRGHVFETNHMFISLIY